MRKDRLLDTINDSTNSLYFVRLVAGLNSWIASLKGLKNDDALLD